MSANTLKFITTFLRVGKINTINPKINPINAIAKSTVAKIVNASILKKFCLLINILIIAVIPAVGEELFFRGIIKRIL